MKKELEDKLREIVDVLMEQSHKSNRYGFRRAGFAIPHNIIIRICNPEDLQY